MESMRRQNGAARPTPPAPTSHSCSLNNIPTNNKAASLLLEQISGLLSQWHALQLAILNRWGGHDSLEKSHQLVFDILSWFSQSKEPLRVEELESFLHESLLLTFNTDIEDGSIEEIAERLMIMHEEFSHRSH